MMQPRLLLDTPLAGRLWAGGPGRLVLLHGFFSDSRAWTSLVDHLLPEWSVLAVDLPGHGLSLERWSPEPAQDWAWQSRAIVSTVRAVWDAPAWLAGYSMGGRAAAHVAETFAEQWHGALIESAHPGLTDPTQRANRLQDDERRAQRVAQMGVMAFADEWQALPLFASQRSLPAEVRDRQQTLRQAQSAAGMAASLRRYGTGGMPPVTQVSLPVTVLAGELDVAYAVALPRWQELCPNAVTRLCPDAGHNVHLEAPSWWLAELRALARRDR